MIGYETEEQQVQAIKQFWKDNGTAIILGALIGLGGLWGWRYYNDVTVTAKENASVAYNESIEAFIEADNTDALNAFVKENADTGYAPLASLIVAQQALDNDDFTAAKAALNTAINDDSALSDVARIRLANVHLQLEEYGQALTVLNAVAATAFADQVEELKGDAYIAQGNYDGAQTAYAAALLEAPNNNVVKMKLDNIAYAQTQASAEGE